MGRGEGSSLVRIQPQTGGLTLEISNQHDDKDKKKEEKWAGQELNSRSPPCQGSIL